MANTLELLNFVNTNFLLNPPAFTGYQAVAQSIANSAWVPLAIDTSEYDNYGGHSNSTNNSRYTAQVAGWYTCNGVYQITSNSTGFRAIRLQKNGSPIVFGAEVYTIPNNVNATGLTTGTKDVQLNVGDYIEVAGWQNSGGALNTAVGGGGEQGCGLWVRFSHF